MSFVYRGVGTRDRRSRVRLGDVLCAFLLIFATAAILIVSRPATATGGAVLTFATPNHQFIATRSDVAALKTESLPDGRAELHILFTAEAAAELSRFSRAAEGARATLAAPGEMIASATIEEPIDGGYLGVTLNNPVRAMRLARLIGGEPN